LYREIMVALDNSQWSDHAADLAIAIARRTGARLTGSHVYAARLHDDRFRQLEPELPERYQSESKLEHLRDVHDDLIGRGLGIISDSYLDAFEARCREHDLPARRVTLEGRNYEELVRDTRATGYDLVVLGAHGLGRVDRSILGSVCERVTRLVDCDVLIARNDRLPAAGPLVVAMDGSPHSFAALNVALALADAGTEVIAVAAFDPFFHGVAFRSLAGVLSEQAAKLFRFKEQETLHDEIIDQGLGEVYKASLVRAQKLVAARGGELKIELLEGKAFDAIAARVAELRPSLLLLGRIGIHHGAGITLGGTAENLLRSVECNVLVVNRGIDEAARQNAATERAEAQPGVRWSAEAEESLKKVPSFARKIARRAIESYARDNGYAEVTPEVYDRARRKFGR
jgi:nucleotide-binding universal stress UspA family protein